jgi:diaminopimelate epimerase
MTGRLTIAKYHGTGNDFVMVEDLAGELQLTPSLVAALCDRRFGVGADGLIRVAPAEQGGDPDADAFMDYLNADGSLAEMCGNGIRCLGKLLYERGHTDQTELEIATRAGRRHLSLHVRGGVVETVTVGMGPPAFRLDEIPMTGPAGATFLQEPFDVGERTWKASAVSMGNPHLVLFVEEDPDGIDVHALGPRLEHHAWFPQKTNVEFVSLEDGALKTRVWERGVGETFACGTGACAVAVAASQAGLVGRTSVVRFPGGEILVEWREDGGVWMTGPAERVFEAEIDPAWLADRADRS